MACKICAANANANASAGDGGTITTTLPYDPSGSPDSMLGYRVRSAISQVNRNATHAAHAARQEPDMSQMMIQRGNPDVPIYLNRNAAGRGSPIIRRVTTSGFELLENVQPQLIRAMGDAFPPQIAGARALTDPRELTDIACLSPAFRQHVSCGDVLPFYSGTPYSRAGYYDYPSLGRGAQRIRAWDILQAIGTRVEDSIPVPAVSPVLFRADLGVQLPLLFGTATPTWMGYLLEWGYTGNVYKPFTMTIRTDNVFGLTAQNLDRKRTIRTPANQSAGWFHFNTAYRQNPATDMLNAEVQVAQMQTQPDPGIMTFSVDVDATVSPNLSLNLRVITAHSTALAVDYMFAAFPQIAF